MALVACALTLASALPARAALGPAEVVPTGPGRPRLLLAPRAGEVAALRVTFAVGSVDDGTSPGLTRLSQYALLEANQRIAPAELAREVWAADGRLEVATGQRTCAFTLVASRRDFSRLVHQILPALLAPRLDPSRLPAATERAVLDVAGGSDDLVPVLTALAARDRAYRTHPPHGVRRVLESIDLADVAAHVQGHLTPANAEVVVTGAFDRAEVIRLVRSFRGGVPTPGEPVALELPFRDRRRAQREVHLLAWPLPLATARDAAAARVLAALLEAELWRQVREAGFAYSFDVQLVRSSWLDALVVALPAHSAGQGDLGSMVRDLVERVRAGKLDDEALPRARTTALAALETVDGSPSALAAALAAGGTRWHGPQVAAAVAALDRADLVAMVGPWLDPQRSMYVYLGPQP